MYAPWSLKMTFLHCLHPLMFNQKVLNWACLFLPREKLHPEGRNTKRISLFYAECFLYIWQRYKFIQQWSITIWLSHGIILGWAVRICCADLCQYRVNLVPILEVFWTLIVRYRMRDRKTK